MSPSPTRSSPRRSSPPAPTTETDMFGISNDLGGRVSLSRRRHRSLRLEYTVGLHAVAAGYTGTRLAGESRMAEPKPYQPPDDDAEAQEPENTPEPQIPGKPISDMDPSGQDPD